MIQTERRETTPTPPIFPLPAENVWQTVDWMNEAFNPKDPHQQEIEVNAFWERHGEFFMFAKEMAKARVAVDRVPTDNIKSYERGFIFAVECMNNRYRELGRDLPVPLHDEMNEYFESHLIDEADDTDLLALKVTQHIPSDKRCTPDNFRLALVQGKLGPDLRKQLITIFNKNTTAMHIGLRVEDNNIDYQLRSKLFYDSFGPHPGLARGVLDGYQLIKRKEEAIQKEKKRQDEMEVLNRMWDAGF